MKRLKLILVLTVINCSAFAQGQLYLIRNGHLWGYMDQTGKTFIRPQFRSAGNFSEGLAAVRLNGYYGYIDQTGKFAIRPQYDLALPFMNGLGSVFIDGMHYFIDGNGTIVFGHNFRNIYNFENHTYAVAITQSKKYCLINRNGKLLTDTSFIDIGPFDDGLAVVRGLNHQPDPEDSSQVAVFETGVIDTTGQWIIPFGKYKDIENFKNGYSFASRFDQSKADSEWSRLDAMIDRKGNIMFIMPVKKYFLDFNNKGFHDGLAVVYIYRETKDPSESAKTYSNDEYKGVINTEGVILFSDTGCKEITPFTYHRAFVQDNNERWKMINTKGEQVGDSTFDNLLFETYHGNIDDLFTNGMAWVEVSAGWVAIDTSGKFLTQPKKFDDFDCRELRRFGDFIVMEEDISVESKHYSYRYGFWNSKTNTTINPLYHDIDISGEQNDLIYAMKDGLMYYITPTGKVIWKEEKIKEKKTMLNIDFMNRGYFYASSRSAGEHTGHGSSKNFSKHSFLLPGKSSDSIQVTIDPGKKSKWYGYQAMKLYVVNPTKDTMFFSAQDSRLYLKLQAIDKYGIWRDIEYLPNSWCGNSYHTLYLLPKHYWEFNTPVYEGAFKTRIRAQLVTKQSRNQKEGDIIYSNEVDGFVNPGQFWNRRKYYPGGIMDPYNE